MLRVLRAFVVRGFVVPLLVVPLSFVVACGGGSTATVALTTQPSPLGLGQNRFEATVTDGAGQPVADAEVSIRLLMPADPATRHPEMKTEGALNNAGGGKYTGIAIVTMAGEWQVTVTARRRGTVIGVFEDRLTAVSVRPRASAFRDGFMVSAPGGDPTRMFVPQEFSSTLSGAVFRSPA